MFDEKRISDFRLYCTYFCFLFFILSVLSFYNNCTSWRNCELISLQLNGDQPSDQMTTQMRFGSNIFGIFCLDFCVNLYKILF